MLRFSDTSLHRVKAAYGDVQVYLKSSINMRLSAENVRSLIRSFQAVGVMKRTTTDYSRATIPSHVMSFWWTEVYGSSRQD